MDLAAIGAFVAVGECGGFRAAATTLGMTSSGVSKAVARLEAALGVELLARTTRSVRLTPAGEAFHARCKSVLADLEQAGHQATTGSASPRGRLTVSMSTVYGRVRVMPVIADYVREHPEVELRASLGDRMVDLVEEGVDLAIRIGHLPDSGLVATRLGWIGYVLCGSPAYLGTAGVPAHPDDLGSHAFVGFVAPGTGTRFASRFMVDGTPRSVVRPARLTVDDGEALVEAAARSLGLVMVADFLAEDLIRTGRLVRLLRSFEMPPVPVSIVHAPTRHPTTAARALIGMLRHRLRSDVRDPDRDGRFQLRSGSERAVPRRAASEP